MNMFSNGRLAALVGRRARGGPRACCSHGNNAAHGAADTSDRRRGVHPSRRRDPGTRRCHRQRHAPHGRSRRHGAMSSTSPPLEPRCRPVHRATRRPVPLALAPRSRLRHRHPGGTRLRHRRLQRALYPAGTAFVDPGHGMVHSAFNPTDPETVIIATFTDVPPTARCRSPKASPPPPTTAAWPPRPPADPGGTDGCSHDRTVMETPSVGGVALSVWCPMGHDVVGRDEELDVLNEFLDPTAAQPRAVVLHGEAGVGKSTLWRAAIDVALRRGLRVLASRPTEAEQHLAFSGIGDLFENVVDEVFPSLPPARRHAMEAALLLGEPGKHVDHRALAIAVRDTLTLTAATAATVVAVDDVQWLDESSSNALSFAWRRLSAPVLLVLARRGKRGDASELEHAVPPTRSSAWTSAR